MTKKVGALGNGPLAGRNVRGDLYGDTDSILSGYAVGGDDQLYTGDRDDTLLGGAHYLDGSIRGGNDYVQDNGSGDSRYEDAFLVH